MKKFFFIFLFCLFTVPLVSSVHAQISGIVFIAHAQVNVNQISRRDLADYYLKKKRSWPNGLPVRPIDWSEGQPARKIFLKNILDKSEGEVMQYWMAQKLSTGDQPPMVLESEDSICSLVATIKGSISYLLASSEIIDTCPGIKLLETTD